MSENNILKLIDENYYMMCVFDENKELILKNKNFTKNFNDINNYDDLLKNVLDIEDNNSDSLYIRATNLDNIIKFERNTFNKTLMLTGVKVDYKKIVSTLRNIESKSKKKSKNINAINFNKIKERTYCTFMVDLSWNIKYFSDNIYDLLKIENPYLKTVDEIFGDEFLEKILEKKDYLDVFNDLCIEYHDKLAVITKSKYGYIVMNIYPYSTSATNRFEEVTSLKYRIEQLENELKRRKQLIDFQKEIIKSLSDKADRCKCI